MSNTELFLDKYKQLEETVKQKYGDGMSIARLESKAEFRRYSAGLKYSRELRNILSHNSKINGKWPVEVSAELISFLDEIIIEINDPPRLCDCALPLGSILYATLDSNVKQVMQEMKVRDISKVPVLDRGRVVGVFSHETAFEYLLSHDRPNTENTTFADIADAISIDGEMAKYYPFARWTELCSVAQQSFDRAYDRHIRIKLMLLTKNGERNEKLMGIVSAWELVSSR